MRDRSSIFLASAALAVAICSPAQAQAQATNEIGYFLNRTDVAVIRTGTITACPSRDGELPTIAYNWKVVSAGAADDRSYVRVDVSGSFLAKRSTAFVLNPNGTLAAFNSSSEGQGGAVLNSLIKAAGSLLLNVDNSTGDKPARVEAPAYCLPKIIAALDRLAMIKENIRDLENNILQKTSTSQEMDLLERRRQQRAEVVKSLTLAKVVQFTGDIDPANVQVVDALEVDGQWFTTEKPTRGFSFDLKQVPGRLGFTVKIQPLNAAYMSVGPSAATIPAFPARALFYRRPIQAEVLVKDNSCNDVANCYGALELENPLLLGQWGKIQKLHVGHGGIFGSRQASAKFDTFGAPTELSFGSDSGSDSIASSIDAGTGFVTSARDANIIALERQIKRLELERKLEEIQASDGAN